MNILIVEDHPVNRLVLFKTLQNCSLAKRIVEAEDGTQGLEKFNSEKFDIIFTDISMPVMNGIDMTIEIRETDKTIPIYAVSAFKSTDFTVPDKLFTGWIMKPIYRNTISDILIFHHLGNLHG